MKNITFRFILVWLVSFTAYGQIIVSNGDMKESLDSIPSDLTIHFGCDSYELKTFFYEGDYTLKGNIYIGNAILNFYGEVNLNGFEFVKLCDSSEVNIFNESLDVPVFNTQEVVLFPNPTEGAFFLNTDYPYEVKIYALDGKYLRNYPDISSFDSGTYIVKIQINNTIITKKVIKK